MANLLPPTAKRQITKEYYLRVASVWMFAATAALLVLLVLLVPLYYLISLQLGAVENSFVAATASGDSFTEVGQEITYTNELAHELNRVVSLPSASSYLNALEQLTKDEINLTTVNIDRENGLVKAVEVTGVATTRAALAAFRDRLETSDTFAEVELPLSNLAKDRAVPFSIKVTVSTPSQ